MRHEHRADPVWPRLLRGVAVGAVLVGYLGVLLGTSVGQGWALLAHVAATPHTAFEAPRLQTPSAAAPALGSTTLRTNTHGAHRHHHAPASSHPNAGRTVRTADPVHDAPEAEVPAGLHAHGGVLHSHDLPAPDPAPVVVHTLDQHRLPLPASVPAPDGRAVADPTGAPPSRLVSVVPSVETPPPIGRG